MLKEDNPRRRLRIGFLGSESTGLKSLRILAEHPEVQLVWVVFDEKSVSSCGLRRLEAKYDLKVVKYSEIEDKASRQLGECGIDAILSVFSPYIVSDTLLSMSTHGGFNLHPGKLPEYAGRDPVSWSIYEEAKEHEVTIHRMTNMVDGGDVLMSSHVSRDKSDTAYDLMSRCSVEGLSLLKRFINQVIRDGWESLGGSPQDQSLRRYRGEFNAHFLPKDLNCKIEMLERFRKASWLGPQGSRKKMMPLVSMGYIVELEIHVQTRSKIPQFAVLYVSGTALMSRFTCLMECGRLHNGS